MEILKYKSYLWDKEDEIYEVYKDQDLTKVIWLVVIRI